ncbi:DUF3037 domain-containing protein [Streptosporangium sp. NPDC000563]|uniref:DUF3037 domain-containing protein n=1 Tax=unclassified Streptosporangium TaxID=2632669 RepID=UPI003321144B
MSRYLYSIIRCLPDPRTGEFVNYGAIAGDPVTGDWEIRQLSKTDRIRKFAPVAVLEIAGSFMLQLGADIDAHRALMEEGGEPLGEEWLQRLHHDHRNVVQLSPPTPILADNAREALERVFQHVIIDPVTQPRLGVTKDVLTRRLRDVYHRADIDESLIHHRPHVFVGAHVNYTMDFAIANGRAVQLTQAWSFRRSSLDGVSMQVKAWGYAIDRLRQGDEARVIDSNNQRVSTIDRNVDLQVVIAPPETSAQEHVFEEAQEIFASLSAQVHSLEDVEAVGARAEMLLRRL